MSAVAFDVWRSNYSFYQSEDHAAIYNSSYKRDPAHASFSGRAVRVFLNQSGGNPVVAEIGGRNGSLAKAALDSTLSIKKWINYEICGDAIAGNIADDDRYESRLMTDFRWWTKEKIEGDLLIMSHFIEHISDEDFKNLLDAISGSIKAVHVQSPLAMRGPTNWSGFNGAHIMTMGWVEVDVEFVRRGFRSTVAYDGASWVRR